jgi:hypothetical protein
MPKEEATPETPSISTDIKNFISSPYEWFITVIYP